MRTRQATPTTADCINSRPSSCPMRRGRLRAIWWQRYLQTFAHLCSLTAPSWFEIFGFGNVRVMGRLCGINPFFQGSGKKYKFQTPHLFKTKRSLGEWRSVPPPGKSLFARNQIQYILVSGLRGLPAASFPSVSYIFESRQRWDSVSKFMMTSSNGNIFRVTGPLWGEFTGHRWIPRTKSNDAELWCFLWSTPEQTVE